MAYRCRIYLILIRLKAMSLNGLFSDPRCVHLWPTGASGFNQI